MNQGVRVQSPSTTPMIVMNEKKTFCISDYNNVLIVDCDIDKIFSYVPLKSVYNADLILQDLGQHKYKVLKDRYLKEVTRIRLTEEDEFLVKL